MAKSEMGEDVGEYRLYVIFDTTALARSVYGTGKLTRQTRRKGK